MPTEEPLTPAERAQLDHARSYEQHVEAQLHLLSVLAERSPAIYKAMACLTDIIAADQLWCEAMGCDSSTWQDALERRGLIMERLVRLRRIKLMEA